MGWFISLGGAAVFLWFISDVRAMMRWNTDLSALAAAGRFDLLPAHCEAGLRTRRVFWRLLQRVLIPGAAEASCSLHFYNLGMHERAWELSRRAMELARGKPAIHAAARATAVLALSGLQRFDEARGIFSTLLMTEGVPPALLASGATSALAEGRISDALSVARRVLERDPADEAAHLSASAALAELGRFEEAIRELEYTPRAAHEQLEARARRMMEEDADGQELMAAQEAERGQVMKPSPHVQAAIIYVEQGDVRAAEFRLSRAAGVLGHHPVIGMHFHATAARVAALQGALETAEKHFREAHACTGKLPSNRGLQVELHVARARAMVDTRQPELALVEVTAASALRPTPYQQRILSLVRGQALASLGRAEEARPAFLEAARAEEGTLTRRKAEEGLAAA